MKLNGYSVYDQKAAAYARPFWVGSDAEAKRSFGDIAQDADHVIGKHPEDYSLCRVGVWDDNNGRLVDEDVQVIVTGLEVLAQARHIEPGSLEAVNGKEATA